MIEEPLVETISAQELARRHEKIRNSRRERYDKLAQNPENIKVQLTLRMLGTGPRIQYLPNRPETPMERAVALVEIDRVRKEIATEESERLAKEIKENQLKKQAEKEQKRVKDKQRAQAEKEMEPRRLLQSFYDLRAGHSDLAEKYLKMTPQELLKLETQIPNYNPSRRYLANVKGAAIEWLRMLRAKKEAQTNPENSESLLRKTLHMFRGQ